MLQCEDDIPEELVEEFIMSLLKDDEKGNT